MGNITLSVEERFWSKVDSTTGLEECWIWLAGKDGHGYGMFWHNTSTKHAHRIAYVLTYGLIPEKQEILHSCDNPPCVNPRHLRAGTSADNSRDMLERHRQTRNNAILTTEQVIEIRNLYATRRYNQTELANMYGVISNVINYAVLGKTWKDAQGPIASRCKARMGIDKVIEIRSQKEAGVSKQELIEKFNSSRRTIERIINNKVYKGAFDQQEFTRAVSRGDKKPQDWQEEGW